MLPIRCSAEVCSKCQINFALASWWLSTEKSACSEHYLRLSIFVNVLSRRTYDLNAAVFLSFFLFYLPSVRRFVNPSWNVFMRVLLNLCCSCKQIVMFPSAALADVFASLTNILIQFTDGNTTSIAPFELAQSSFMPVVVAISVSYSVH